MSATIELLLKQIKELEEKNSLSPSEDNVRLLKKLKEKLISANESIHENKNLLKS